MMGQACALLDSYAIDFWIQVLALGLIRLDWLRKLWTIALA